MTLHQAVDLLDHPERPPGWTFTDPTILDGWGRGSSMVPALIASAHPDLAAVGSFLDVGTGVGLLAIAAAGVWPEATVVGIDPWQPSLDRARAHVTGSGLDDRITLRQEALEDIADAGAFDCVWIPSFFLDEGALERGLVAATRALRPGGWIALGRMRPPPHPLAEAVGALRTARAGSVDIEAKQASDLLVAAGCEDVHVFSPPGPAPLELVLGRRPG
jgi:SAM-dependent methyltransferase